MALPLQKRVIDSWPVRREEAMSAGDGPAFSQAELAIFADASVGRRRGSLMEIFLF